MSALQIKVKGLAELEKALRELPAKIEANIMRGALRAGAKSLQAEARQRAPMGPPSQLNKARYGGRAGLLRDSIRVTGVRLVKGRMTVGVEVGGKVKDSKKGAGGDAYYAYWVEMGTKPHIIRARKRGGKRGRLAPGGRTSVMHPGAQAQPFMRPALDAGGEAAVRAAGEYIRNRLATKHGINVPDPEAETE